ncbi:hypothetical protein D3C81_2254240 [compost metagenome]
MFNFAHIGGLGEYLIELRGLCSVLSGEIGIDPMPGKLECVLGDACFLAGFPAITQKIFHVLLNRL